MYKNGNDTDEEFTNEAVDALAYSYVLSHGYEGALAMLQTLIDNHRSNDVGPSITLVVLCQRIVTAIDDEAATITRILDRMIPTIHSGAELRVAEVSFPPLNPIDRHIGDRLRQRRSYIELSVATLAADLGLTPEELAAVENGAIRLDLSALERAAKRLDVPATYFFQTSDTDNDAIGALQ